MTNRIIYSKDVAMRKFNMFYYVKGGNNKYRQTISEALCFAKDYLLPRHRNIEIEVEVNKNLKADADVFEGDYDRHFVIRVRKGMEREDLLTAIFHEFVHIKQSIRKEFDIFDIDDTPYFDRPYEQEAYALQEKMLEKFKKTLA
jgi:hypothetical protein